MLNVCYMLDHPLRHWDLKLKELIKSLPSRSQCNGEDRPIHGNLKCNMAKTRDGVMPGYYNIQEKEHVIIPE